MIFSDLRFFHLNCLLKIFRFVNYVLLFKMSFFEQKGDDSNLQYDDTAFLFFIASFIVVTAITTVAFLIKDFELLNIYNGDKLAKSPMFTEKLNKLKLSRRRKCFSKGFFIRVGILVVLTLTFLVIYKEVLKSENKLQGFDPYKILGVPNNAPMKDVKKAYRKLAL